MLTFTVFNDIRNMQIKFAPNVAYDSQKNIYFQCQLWHTIWTFIPSHVVGLATVYGYICILSIKNPSSQVVAGI